MKGTFPDISGIQERFSTPLIYNLAKVLIAIVCIIKTLQFKCFSYKKLKNERMQKFSNELTIKKNFLIPPFFRLSVFRQTLAEKMNLLRK